MGREHRDARGGAPPEPSIEAALGVVEPFLNTAARNILHAGLPEARDGLDPPTAKQLKADQLADLLPPSLWPADVRAARAPVPDWAAGVAEPDAWTSLADVAPEPVRWLWPGLLPAGKLTVLAGDPGTGKSFLALDWAARVSAGRAFPGGVRREESGVGREEVPSDAVSPHSPPLTPHSVRPAAKGAILFCGEDDPADTVRPRLDALGADPRRVTLAGCVTTKSDRRRAGVKAVRRTYDLAADLPRLRAKLDHDAAAGRPAGLVVVDPLAAFVPRTNRNHEGATRLVLDPLAALARETGAAVVVVIHLRKDRSGPAVLGPLGSIAQAAVARSVLLATADPAVAGGGLIRPAKANLAGRVGVIPFKIAGGVVNYSPARKKGPGPAKSQRQFAAEWIREYLADGPRLARDAMRDGLAAGVCRSTLKLARRDLGLRKHRFHDPAGVDARGRATGALWIWALPGQDPAAAAPGHLRAGGRPRGGGGGAG